MNPLQKTNSWHWLLMAMAVCVPVAGYFCHLVWKKAAAEDGPKLLGMEAHASELKLLREEDVILLEQQAAEIQKRIHTYEAAVHEKVGQPIPSGEQSVGKQSNEINRALLSHQLNVVEQEQVEVRDVRMPATPVPASGTSPEVALALAAQAAAANEAEQDKQSLPFTTREIRYVVEGEYKQMFMFLVRQSHLKPSYHLKNIKITPAPQGFGMRMEFTVQIHFT